MRIFGPSLVMISAMSIYQRRAARCADTSCLPPLRSWICSASATALGGKQIQQLNRRGAWRRSHGNTGNHSQVVGHGGDGLRLITL
jgi:hypothetical protein